MLDLARLWVNFLFRASFVRFGLNKESGRRLPIEQRGQRKTWFDAISSPNLGTYENTLGRSREDFKRHSVPTVGGNAHKVSQRVMGFTGKRSVVDVVENWLIPIET